MRTMRIIAPAAIVALISTSALANGVFPALPLDESIPHKGFEFVVHWRGADWYSERGWRHLWNSFDLMRGSFVGGRPVQIWIYEADCQVGQVRVLSGGQATRFADFSATLVSIDGDWHRPPTNSPEAIRLGELCVEQAAALSAQ